MDEFIVLDIETTGLDNKHDSIIEIAATRVKNFQVVGEFQTLVRPNASSLNATVAELTGITAEDLKTAPNLLDIKQKLFDFVGGNVIIGHNISFDLDFLKSHGIDLPGKGLDTLELAHTLLPKLKFYSLEYLSHYYNFSNQPSHRAMRDVLATVELCQLFVERFQSFPADLQKQIKSLVDKSNWEWAFVFNQELPTTTIHQTISSKLSLPNLIDNVVSATIDTQKWQAGFSAYELSPNSHQLPVNINLAKSLAKSILVVSPEVFHNTNWAELDLKPYYSNLAWLDQKRFEFLLNKPTFDEPELKLAIKILITLQANGEFDPAKLHLTREEFYLFEQKLSNIGQPDLSALPNQIVTHYNGLDELLANNLSTDTVMLLPEWLKFDEWWIEKNVKVITPAYLNAVVSSRRDFVHDFVTDRKLSDQLFKNLNDLGSHLVMTMALVGMVWQEQQRGQINTTELEEAYLTSKNGTGLKDNLKGVMDSLNEYLTGIKDLTVPFPEVLQRQLLHTEELIEQLSLLIDPSKAYKVFLDGFEGSILVRIIKLAPTNIWQTQLKKFKVGIISNSLLVSGSSNFVSSILGEDVKVQSINVPTDGAREIVWIKDISAHNKNLDYEKKTFNYLKNWVEKEPGKVLILMPNLKMVTDFFNDYQPKMAGANLLSRDVIGNADMLVNKLNSLNKYALVVGYYNLDRWLPAFADLDRTLFVKLSFDRLGKTAQLLVADRFSQSFNGYALPKAVIDFKGTLADLYSKTKEVWVLDQRLQTHDYGKVVMNSVVGFHSSDLVID